MRRTLLPNKFPGEIVPCRFDFSSSMQNDTLIGSPTVQVNVYSGVDAAAGAMLVGASTRVGNVVTQNLGGGVAGVIYSVICFCSTNGGAFLEMQGFVVCEGNPL